MCIEADAASKRNDTKELFNIVKKLNGHSPTTSPSSVNKRNGEPATSFTELLEEWAEYFKELLNANATKNSDETPPAEHNLNIVSKAVKSIKTGKSLGNDHNVTAEALKHGGDQLTGYLQQIFNIVLNHEEAPAQWKKAIIIPVPKKPIKNMSNFRGISLMSIAAKVFNRVILNRICNEISPRLRPFQAGFRRSKSCTEQIHIIRQILKQYHQKNIPTVMTFIDFKKAFDSINGETMWKILRHYGICEKMEVTNSDFAHFHTYYLYNRQ